MDLCTGQHPNFTGAFLGLLGCWPVLTTTTLALYGLGISVSQMRRQRSALVTTLGKMHLDNALGCLG